MKRHLLSAAGVLAVSVAFASDPSYTAMRTSRPDGRTVPVNNLAFDRDVYHVSLTGTMHLLAPVNGTTVGAVFDGRGSYELTPASDTEQKMLVGSTTRSLDFEIRMPKKPRAITVNAMHDVLSR